ncbi:MAG: hypothetical protein GX638_19240 [Crenarchaeota archaeon]|nr:hypothetical protein [Thermoproteota archaeon]
MAQKKANGKRKTSIYLLPIPERPPMKMSGSLHAAVLSVFIFFPLFPLSAGWIGDWNYEGDTIVGYRGTGGEVTIISIILNPLDPFVVRSVEISGNDNITAIHVSERIENVCIHGFSELTSINLPSTVISFGNGEEARIVKDCPKLTQIEVNEANSTYKSIDGILYSKDGSTLVRYPPGRTGSFSSRLQ